MPFLSIIIPMRNEQEMIEPLFKALLPIVEQTAQPFEGFFVTDRDGLVARVGARHDEHG